MLIEWANETLGRNCVGQTKQIYSKADNNNNNNNSNNKNKIVLVVLVQKYNSFSKLEYYYFKRNKKCLYRTPKPHFWQKSKQNCLMSFHPKVSCGNLLINCHLH